MKAVRKITALVTLFIVPMLGNVFRQSSEGDARVGHEGEASMKLAQDRGPDER